MSSKSILIILSYPILKLPHFLRCSVCNVDEACWCLCVVPNDPRRVIVTKLTLVVDDRPDVDIDLTGECVTINPSALCCCCQFIKFLIGMLNEGQIFELRIICLNLEILEM